MAIFLKVLGIIGIVLLSVLGLILLVIFLVLFVPVRYKAEGSFKDNKPSFSARASWLLHLVSVRYALGADEPLIIKICGFKLKKKEDKTPDFDDSDEFEEDSKEYPQASLDTPDTDVNATVSASYEPPVSTVSETVPSEQPTQVEEEERSIGTEDAKVSEVAEEEPASSKPKIAEGHKKASKAPKDKGSNKDFENRGFYDKIKKYIEIIESKRFKKAFEYSKDKIVKLLKHILPRRIRINGEVGFDDPSVTGQILVITSMLIPVFGDKINIRGNFEEPVIDIDGYLKGRITLFKVLWTLAVLYFNKNIRKIIKMFREV